MATASPWSNPYRFRDDSCSWDSNSRPDQLWGGRSPHSH